MLSSEPLYLQNGSPLIVKIAAKTSTGTGSSRLWQGVLDMSSQPNFTGAP
jgi:hypothetical protein